MVKIARQIGLRLAMALEGSSEYEALLRIAADEMETLFPSKSTYHRKIFAGLIAKYAFPNDLIRQSAIEFLLKDKQEES